MIGPRHALRTLLDANLRRRLEQFADRDWLASAMIIAPHPDDETLGCGGIAIKKIAAGAPTSFVFVTDGAASHHGRIEPEKLRALREAEAREAVQHLGASPDSITFLRYPDAQANAHTEAIAADISRLLRRFRPESVFVPHAKDPPSDHGAVNAAVRIALREFGRPVTVYEYPVWYWYHWPWVRLHGDLPGMWRTITRQTFSTRGGLRALSALNRQAYVGDVLERKRAALAAHVTQMRRPEGDAGWTILADLAGGDLMRRLTADYEAFWRYEVNA